VGLRSVSGFFVVLPRLLSLDSESLRAVVFLASNPGGGRGFYVFKTPPIWPGGLLSLLYNGYQDFVPGIKRPRRGAEHPPLILRRS